jgi:hypothetical protein
MLLRWQKEYREGKTVADSRTKVIRIRKEANELNRIKQLEDCSTETGDRRADSAPGDR